MYKELYSLVTQKDELDESFVYDAFDILMEDNDDLYDYIRDFRIDDSITDLANYNLDRRLISISPQNISSQTQGICENYNKRMLAISSIVHEMEHAKGFKKVLEGRDDIESLILRYSMIDYLIKYKLDPSISIKDEEPLYIAFWRKQYYDYNPGERLAAIRGYKFVVNMLQHHRNDPNQIPARALLLSSYARGYENNRYYIDPPTYTYLLKMRMFREYYSLVNRVRKNNYSLDTRVTYGLPLTYEEFDKELLRKVRLRRRL